MKKLLALCMMNLFLVGVFVVPVIAQDVTPEPTPSPEITVEVTPDSTQAVEVTDVPPVTVIVEAPPPDTSDDSPLGNVGTILVIVTFGAFLLDKGLSIWKEFQTHKSFKLLMESVQARLPDLKGQLDKPDVAKMLRESYAGRSERDRRIIDAALSGGDLVAAFIPGTGDNDLVDRLQEIFAEAESRAVTAAQNAQSNPPVMPPTG